MTARVVLIFMVAILSVNQMEGRTLHAIVADSVSKNPLPYASIFDCKGKIIGICNTKGAIPHISASSYPITVRYLGFKDKTVDSESSDTIFLQETFTELPEVTVESKQHKVLHILAYVREFSTLSTFTDTVFLFREKTVDYMIPTDSRMSFKGWSNPRVINSKSYYRFSNSQGLDSVSDESHHHFSWSDWIGIMPIIKLPDGLRFRESGSDTIMGKYSPTEIWVKHGDRLTVNVNVLADTVSRKWVPNLSSFFRGDLDFETFRVRYSYENVTSDSITPMDLTGYSFNIESNGRGHGMFRFNRVDEPFFVSTYAEVYLIEKEFITVKEAKKLAKRGLSENYDDRLDYTEVSELQPAIQALVSRVSKLNKGKVRLNFKPDPLLGTKHGPNNNFSLGNRILFMLKDLTGITLFKARRNMSNQWKDFKRERIKKNQSRGSE